MSKVIDWGNINKLPGRIKGWQNEIVAIRGYMKGERQSDLRAEYKSDITELKDIIKQAQDFLKANPIPGASNE